ncbi:LA2681 family HEPN domain-containing protein [Pseudomonas silvicola]|nr:LA2681 family HEPN domain-containing protein [Pseudomonas silvicola]
MLITTDEITKFSLEADTYILSNDHRKLEELVTKITEQEYEFEHQYNEAQYLYTAANCYSVLYGARTVTWHSDDLMKAVILYRRALHCLPKTNWMDKPDIIESSNQLRSMILTNLANSLSSQGRAFCCLPFYDEAIALNQKPEAIISKARNQLFLGESLFDNGHREYHYFVANNLIKTAQKNINALYPEHKTDIEKGGDLYEFSQWFEQSFDQSSFDYFSEKNSTFKNRKENQYLQWCAQHKLFINDLNDVCDFEICYQDVISLPSISRTLNTTLALHEELAYHGNFDEIKNDYCYARYIYFSATNIPADAPHMFNSSYNQVDDMSHSINNLKTSHYKSSFRTLYSLFDKIAYIASRFFDLNDIKDDRSISIDNLFRDIKSKNRKIKWEPNEKLKNSDNHFIHALFYILKDIRDVTGTSSVSKWIDPDASAFSEIRNAMEHRSLKIVDDFGYELTYSYSSYHDDELQKLKIQAFEINKKIESVSDAAEALALEDRLNQFKNTIYEKEKLSTHSLLIPITQFDSRLMTLIKLARNSIMYLSLAIHFEERKRPNDQIWIPMELPLKD